MVSPFNDGPSISKYKSQFFVGEGEPVSLIGTDATD
jgi:hypothetical protein